MESPKIPQNETVRLQALREFNILDTMPEERFDRLTRLAQNIFGVDIALISLVDTNRQWFKSKQGLDACETGRDISFCGHAILEQDTFVIPDALLDLRFADNPLVTGAPNIRFYAGVPLSPDGKNSIGTLCIIDSKPRQLSDKDLHILRDLADSVEQEIFQLHQSQQHQALLALTKISSLLNNDYHQLLSQALQLAQKFLGMPNAMINRIRDKNCEILIQSGTAASCEGLVVKLEQTLCSITIARNTLVLLPDVKSTDYQHLTENSPMTIGSFVGAPITIRGELFGSLVFSSPDIHIPQFFSKIEIEFIQLFTEWLNNKIHEWSLDQSLKSQEQQLAHAYDLLEQSNTAARIGTWEFDLLNAQVKWSKVTQEIHEVNEDYVCSVTEAINFCKIGKHQEHIAHLIQRTINEGVPYDTEIQIVTSKKNERWVRMVGVGQFQNGVCERLYGTMQDISERKRIEKMKDEFISTVSHELRTPLTSISGALALMANGVMGEIPEKIKHMLQIAQKNSQRLSLLINDLLDMEKISAGQLQLNIQHLPLAPILQTAIESNLAAGIERMISIVLEDTHADILVACDTQRFLQVLSNLFSNAIKYSPNHGHIQITVEQHLKTVRISIKDQGPGIPIEFQSRLFNKFAQADSSDTRQRGGTGLGLAISKELMEAMHGHLGFSSIYGEGACFYVDLPIEVTHH